MKRRIDAVAASALCAIALGMPSVVEAQSTLHSTEASPNVYRVVAQSDRYRVIAVTWRPGERDTWHSHPEAATYFLSFCHLRLHSPDGKSREVSPQKDSAFVNPPVKSHSVENIGQEACRLVMFEPK